MLKHTHKLRLILVNILKTLLLLAAATLLSLLLSNINDDNNPFAVPVFILTVALIARATTGYVYGIVASLVSVMCVNYMFTYPFFEFDMSIAGYPLTFAAMLVVSVIISTLTTQIKQQERLRYAMEAEKTRADLLRSVSHDLRTPLTSIVGSCSILLDSPQLDRADQRELLLGISKDAHWLIRVTENILSLTKLSTPNVQLRKESEVIEEIVGSAIVKFRKNHPSISVTVDRPEIILLCPMDATLIEQVLVNLFENVAIHAENADRITVRIEKKSDRAIIAVEDNGAGFSRDQLNAPFDGHCTPKNAVSDNHRNMGIGLSLCRSIVRAHGGDISIGNLAGGGASVRFWLPCEEEDDDYVE